MSKTNCCNCGAALDIFAPKCKFCGTKNVNITDIDLASGEAVNFIFKLPNNFTIDGDLYMSMLAVPELKTLEIINEPIDIYGSWGNAALACIDNRSLEMEVNFHVVPHVDNSLFHLTNVEGR